MKPTKSLEIKYGDEREQDIADFTKWEFKMLCELIEKQELESVIIETDSRINMTNDYYEMFEDLKLDKG